jgi:hypothetical protein
LVDDADDAVAVADPTDDHGVCQMDVEVDYLDQADEEKKNISLGLVV